MNIGRASVYAAFPNKEILFLRALERYRERYTLPCLSLLDENRAPLDVLGALFDCLAARYADPANPSGCLVVLNTGHVTAKRALAASVAEGESRIARTLRQAVMAGALRADAAVPALARFLVSTTQGMATMARLGRSRQHVREIGHTALTVLPRPASGHPASELP